MPKSYKDEETVKINFSTACTDPYDPRFRGQIKYDDLPKSSLWERFKSFLERNKSEFFVVAFFLGILCSQVVEYASR